MNVFQNLVGVNFMVWETNPVKRNQNNVIKFYRNKKKVIQSGDVLIGEYSETKVSVYTVKEILNEREGAMKNEIYVEAVIEWEMTSPAVFKGIDFSNCSSSFEKLCN